MDTNELPELRTDNPHDIFHPNDQFEGCPVRPRLARSNYGVELLSHDLVRSGFLDRRMRPRSAQYYRDLGASPLVVEFVAEGNLNFMEPEKHDRIRNIVNKAFLPEQVDAFRPVMREISRAMVADFIDKGECDLIAEFCHLYPVFAFARFLGVPEADCARIGDATVQTRMLGQVPYKPGEPVLVEALRFLHEYVSNLIAARRRNPEDGFIDALIALKDNGEQISESELVWGAVFLLMGGHDTTRFTLGNCLYSLIDLGLWDELAERPDDIPDSLREAMRYCPGTTRQMRVVHETYEMEGHRFEQGDIVALNLGAASHDPDVFDNEDEFRLRRKPTYGLGFGFGRHICLGMHFARAEMEEAIAVLTGSLAQVEIAGECAVKPTGVITGYDSLPIHFVPRR